MSASTDHLNEEARRLLELSDAERIAQLHAYRWIGYPAAKESVDRLEQLFSRPRVNRMRNLLVVGDTNNGKSEILKRFQSLHPGDDNPQGDAIVLPVMIVQCPPVPDEGRLYDEILQKLNAPFKRKEVPGKKLHEVSALFSQIGIRMLILDEFHDILAGPPAKQQTIRNVIKYLGNELKISIAAAGISEAFQVLQSDDQLANRFDSIVLPKWTFNDNYLRLLASFETALPLRYRSDLHEGEMAQKLLSMSEGLIGEIATILNEACEAAIKDKKERIDLDLLKKLKWQQPSHRRHKYAK